MSKIYLVFHDDLVNDAFEEMLQGAFSNEEVADRLVEQIRSAKDFGSDDIVASVPIEVDDPELLNRIAKE